MKIIFELLLISMLMAGGIARAQQGPPRPPSPEARLQHISSKLEKELSLSATQRQKVEVAYKNFFASMEKLRGNNPPPPPPGKKEDVEKLVKARDEQIKKALNAEQY